MSLENALIDALIASYGVSYSVIYRGVKKNALGGKSEMDHWIVSFTKGAGCEVFDYFTGMGNREIVRGMKAMRLPNAHHIKGNWQASKPVPPPAAGVLSSLILDMAADCTSFRNWCDEFGYDDDSITARKTYDACQENADKLKRIFNFQQLDQLADALHDY